MLYRFLLFCCISLPFLAFPASAQQGFKLKNGDLLFQDLDCGPMCEAIESVTTGYKNCDFSHVAIVKIQPDGEILVLEAIGPNVHFTSLDKFLNRQLDADMKPKVAVGRLRKPYRKLIPEALATGENLLHKPYDDVFAMNNDAYYCSELVYEMFKTANQGREIFPLYPMNYAAPGSAEIMPLWIDYFGKLQTTVPQNAPGLNPGGISCSKKLKIYFPYGQPAKRKKSD